ncbi:PEPxxWA-CTERM sorting domain-containing protein [uncultured Phenylobacterium sp.]|uniref:Npun_F0296 family exosortase-dependent surface protein n=1 Tax=uncultured Phenylobacterium sp. TaxID=349273 RepID=UPI0025FAC2CE|nr:PEPxxWA-CTERM sorting domain-containing protein [uncultured Phenylobacterium sp.]
MRPRTPLRTFFATAVVVAVAALAAPASAAVTVSVTSMSDPNTLPVGQVLIADFNDAQNPEATLLDGFTLDLMGSTVGWNEGANGYSGTLPNDPTHYLTIPGSASATLFSVQGLRSFSFYMGSADTYNSVRFIGANGFDQTLNGGQMTQGYTGQSWNWGARVNFDFGGATVNQIVLTSSGNSFELDNLAGAVQQAVPEPSTWAMLILGFGAIGAVLRRRRAVLTPV